MPFFDIFKSCKSKPNRNESRTCNISQICSGSNFLSCCNNIGNIFNLAPASDENDSDATSTINETVSCFDHSVQVFQIQGDQPRIESDSTRAIGTTGIQSSLPSNKIMISVTPNINDSSKRAEYENWSGIYNNNGEINGKRIYKHTSGDFFLWFHDVKS